MNEKFYSIGRGSLNINGKFYYGLDYQITDLMINLEQENKQLKDNWNKLKEYLINDINDRNGNKVVEFEDGNRVSETISPIYTLMEDKSKTMKEVLDKMQEIEQGSGINE